MLINGVYCLPLTLCQCDKDEVKVVWDFDDECYIIPCRGGHADEVLHEDGTWRVPKPHALALAWATMRSMNKRHEDGLQRRRNKV